MSGLVRSARIGAGRDREADYTGQRLVYRTIGDSNTEGYGASLEYAGGLRPWLLRYLESYRGDVRAVGTKGYGDTFWGSATYGSFGFRYSWWDHDGMSGEKIGYEVPSLSVTSGSATITSSAPHGMAAGALFRWTTAPAPFSTTALYIVNTAPTTTTFTLKATSAGAAVQATESGPGFEGLTGIITLPPILAAAAPERETVIIFPSVGTNDILALMAAGATAQAAATETHRRLRLLLRESILAWPDPDQLLLFGGLPQIQPGSTAGVAPTDRQQAVTLYRALAESEIESRGSRFRYRNIWADVGPGDNIGDGIHVIAPAYRNAGINLGVFVREVTGGAVSGRPWPRSFTKRERTPKLALTGTTGRVTGPSFTIGANTFAFAVSYKPDTGDLPADGTTRPMVWLGTSDYNTGFGLASRNTTGVAGRAGVNVYLMGAALASGASGYTFDAGLGGYHVLREGEWTDWLVLYNLESLRCTVWLNGDRLTTVSIASAWNIIANTWKIGHISTGLPASEGHYQDFELAIGSQLTDAVCSELAKARYAERRRLSGTVDFRRLNEGTGTAAASTVYGLSSATLSGLSGWVDADTSVAPWEH